MRTSPRSVNLMALPTRFTRICRRRDGSVWIVSGSAVVVVDFQVQPFLVGPHLNDADNVVHQRPQRAIDGFDRQSVGFDPRQVENVVDQLQQDLSVLGNRFQELALILVGHVRAQQQIGEAQNGRHGRADLVAHVGQELALGAVGGVGPAAAASRSSSVGLAFEDDLGGRFRQVRQEGVVFFRDGVLGEHGQHADRFAVGVVELVAGERHQSQFSRPLVVGHLRIGGYAVGQKPLVGAHGNAADLVAAQRHAAIRAVGVGVASRAGHQVQTFVAAADMHGARRWPWHECTRCRRDRRA